MKLQHKLALYNTFTKIAIIAVLGMLVVLFVDRISINNLHQKLIDKRNKLIANLSDREISELLQQQNSFTDYNLLKEEYIILTGATHIPAIKLPIFTQENREIDGDEEGYLILLDYFSYGGKAYKLEIGETMLLIEEFQNTILYFTMIILAIAVVLSILADLAFTRIILSPFYKIIDQKINKVDDPIHFNYVPTKTTTDDFALLDNSISALMRKISHQMLTEKQFITNVSHELLTPISILRTRLENILNEEGLAVVSQEKLVASLKTLGRLKAIINSLLLISKIENQQYLKTDEIDVPLLISDIYEELEDRLLEKNIKLEISLAHQISITGNQALLHTLCINLINNAIKYNKQNGRIIVKDELSQKNYKLLICDEGIGMDEGQIEKAFGRFEKLNKSDNESYGLGLAIAKSIAAFHGFELKIVSEKDVGTTVILTFRESV